jgi:hypothetical protein
MKPLCLIPGGSRTRQNYKEMHFNKVLHILTLNKFHGSTRKFSSIKDVKGHFKNKETYIMSQWVVDFPTHSTLTYDEVSSLSSRSKDVNKWFSKASEEFNLYKEAPSWFLAAGKDPSDWSRDIQDKYAMVKEMNREYSQGVNKISSDARNKMDILDKTHKEKLVRVLSETPELVFELMNSQMLPFETHLKAFEFSSKEEAKNFIAKELAIFKENKYRGFLSGDMSSTELVEILFEK